MSFTLNANNPPASQLLSVSQGILQTNSNYWLNTLGKDHSIFDGDNNLTTFEGRHLQVSLFNQANDNLPFVGDGSDSQIWDSNGRLFWRNSTSAAILLTSSNNLNGSVPIIASGNFAARTSVGNCTINFSKNITKVERISKGTYKITMTVAYTSANYYVMVTAGETTDHQGYINFDNGISFAPTSSEFQLFSINSSGSKDNTPDNLQFIVFGG